MSRHLFASERAVTEILACYSFPNEQVFVRGFMEWRATSSSPHYYLLFDVLTVLIGSSLLTFSQFSATYSTLPPLRRPRGSPRQHPQASSHCRPHGFPHRRPHGSLHGRPRRFPLADVLTAPHCRPQYFLLIDVLTVFLDFLSAFSI